MTRATIAGGATVTALAFLVVGVAVWWAALQRHVEPARSSEPAIAAAVQPGFIYGRVTDHDGVTFVGRLRWGGDQEAFWNDYFNGMKADNTWAAHTPGARPRTEQGTIEVFGLRFGDGDRSSNLDRQFMVRFGDIARVEAQFRHVLVTLKSGTVFDLDRFDAGDIDDGVRVWDSTRGVVDLDARRIHTIEFLPTAPIADPSERLHGTVRTRQGDFTGFIQWDRHDCVGADELEGHTADGERSLRYDTIRSIARQSRDSVQVTLLDGREMVLSGTREVGGDHRGIYLDDVRYGRVLISWDAFERVEFSPGGSGPGYRDFRSGRALAGSVSTRNGRRIAGRLVYDLDESETTDTLDTSSQGLDYYIPFDLIASIVPRDREARDAPRATVTMRDGRTMHVERAGDLADGNAGMLIFVAGHERPEYVPWADVEQVDLDHPTSGQP
jgi:hypothetical protein